MKLSIPVVVLLCLTTRAMAGETFRLRPGDEIQLALRTGSRVLLERQTIAIAPDGFLYLPFGGRVEVQALDTTKVRAAIAEEAQRAFKLRRPALVEFSFHKLAARLSDMVSVVGAVEKPGPLAFQPGMTLRDAVALAGGYATKARVREVQFIHQERITSMPPLEALSGPLARTVLQPGDLVVASEESRPVTVFGIVNKPGPIDWFVGMRVTDAIGAAGGFESIAPDPRGEAWQADLGEVRIHRGDQVIATNLTGLFVGSGAAINPPIVQPGDLVYVPALKDRCTVIGAVERPGSYPVRAGDRVLDLVGRAGMLAEETDRLGDLLVRRGNGTVVSISLRELLSEGKTENNVLAQANDLILVPYLGRVAVVGEVAKPGLFPLTDRRTWNSLVFLAAPTERADLQRVVILRNGQSVGTPQSVAPSGNSPSPGAIELHPNDVLFVPPREGVFVVGAVNGPGLLPPLQSVTLIEAFKYARGLHPQADTRKISVMRSTGGRVVTLTPNYDALVKGDPRQNVALQPGDIVIVPFARPSSNVLSRIDPLYFIGLLTPFLLRR